MKWEHEVHGVKEVKRVNEVHEVKGVNEEIGMGNGRMSLMDIEDVFPKVAPHGSAGCSKIGI